MIREVTETLVDHIQAATPDLGDWVAATSLHKDGPVPTADKLHIYLYAIAEHGHLRNAPMVRTDDGYERPPLSVRLHYLAAYFGDGHLEAQSRLTRVLEVFHATPILKRSQLRAPLAAMTSQITVRLLDPTSEEKNQIWSSLGHNMRPSLYYEVDVAPVEMTSPDGIGVIDELHIEYGTVGS